MAACFSGKVNCVQLLLEAKADAECRIKVDKGEPATAREFAEAGESPEHQACASLIIHQSNVETLLKHDPVRPLAPDAHARGHLRGWGRDIFLR